MKFEAVLFDFDGTLINTNDLCFDSYRYAFRRVLNREIEMPEILNLFGRPLDISLGDYGDAQEALCREYRKFNETNHNKLVKRFDGAEEGVRMIYEQGFKTAIVTSKRVHMCREGLKWLGIEDCIDVLVTPEDTSKHKPDPAPILLACERLGVKPSRALMVGDSIFDMAAGKAAGTGLCAVKYSVTPHEKLEEMGLDYFVESLVELAELLK